MEALEYWKIVTVDESNLLDLLIAALGEHDIEYWQQQEVAAAGGANDVVERGVARGG